MALSAGTQLGPYEIVGALGAVYRGRDTRDGREVAIQPLRPQRVREALAIAALSHPHLCQLHDVGQDAGLDFIVMEMVEGKTLAGRLFAGALPLAEALEIGIQIADGLELAHGEGLVHGEVEASRVLLTPRGAKLLAPSGEAQASPARAPEQLLERAVDARADVFALGGLLFEMLAGRRPFETSSLHEPTPSLREAAPATPAALERLVTTCLSVDPADRWSSARDVKRQLVGLLEDHEVATTPQARPLERRARRPSRLPWFLAGILVGAAAGVLGGWMALQYGPRVPRLAPPRKIPAGPSERVVLSVQPPPGLVLVPGEAPQISPDGRTLAFVGADGSGRSRLYVRSLDALVPRALAGTEGAVLPFWSPDSRRLAFFAGGNLNTIALAGGAPVALAPALAPRGGSWSRDERILFVSRPTQPPSLVPAAGGDVTSVPVEPGPRRGARVFPEILPDGRHYLYLDPSAGLCAGSLDGPDSTHVLPGIRGSVRYIEPGYLLYRRDSALVAQRFDAGARQVAGEPVVLAEEVGASPLTQQALFSASDTGVVVYAGAPPVSQLAWFDRAGVRLAAATEPGTTHALCLADGGRTIVHDIADPASGNIDLWMRASDGAGPTRLTTDAAADVDPVCVPGTKDVLFASLRDGSPSPYRLTLGAGSAETKLQAMAEPTLPTDASAGGKLVVTSVLDPKTGWDVMGLPQEGGEPVALVRSGADERQARLSPDGKLLAYVSNETGTDEVYVKLFPGTGPGIGVRWQISRGGGLQPQWRGDSAELYYLGPDRKLTAVPVKSARQRGRDGPDFAAGDAVPLFQVRVPAWEGEGQGAPYAPAPDGARFLVSTAAEGASSLTVLQGWREGR